MLSSSNGTLPHVDRLLQMVCIVPQAVIEGDKVVTGPAKKGRAPRTQVDAEISRALVAVPEWARASLVSVVVPCLIKFYGARDNPWDVDGKSKTDFKNLLDALLRRVHPERQHDISRSDKIWRYVSVLGILMSVN